MSAFSGTKSQDWWNSTGEIDQPVLKSSEIENQFEHVKVRDVDNGQKARSLRKKIPDVGDFPRE